MRRFVGLLPLVALSAALFLGCPRKPAEVRVGYLPITGDVPFFVAMEKGYFSHEGVTVKATPFREAKEAMDALIAGQVDVLAPVSLTPIFGVEQNQPGTLRMALPGGETEGHVVSHVLVKLESPINSVDDLKGKRIGTFVGGAQKMWLELFLKRVNIDPAKDVTIIQVSPDLLVPSLLSGQYDALYATEPYTSMAVAKGLAKVLVENPRSKYIIDPFVSGASLVFTSKFWTAQPRTAKKAYSAMKKGIEFLEANAADAKRMIPKYAPTDTDVVLKSDLGKFYAKVSPQTADAIQKEADLLTQAGILTKHVDVKSILLYDKDFK